MNRMTTSCVVIAVLMLGIGIDAKDKTSSNRAQSMVQKFTDAYNNKDIDKLSSLYAIDAIMVSEGGVVTGRDAIKGRLSSGIQRGNTIASLSPERNETSGALSFTEGSAEVLHDGQRMHRQYLVIVKRAGDHDEIVVHYSLPNSENRPQ